jgi:hypothetical protein
MAEEKKFGLQHSTSRMKILDENVLQNFRPTTELAFSWEATETWNFVDQENKMMLVQNPSWDPNGDNGRGDSIGRSFNAYFIYGEPRFLEGIEACWERVERKGWLRKLLFGKYYYQGYRYPHRYSGEVGLSRDHTINTILAFKYAGYSDEFLKDFVKHLRYKISDFASFTPEMWLWARAAAKIRPYTTLYLSISYIVTSLTAWRNKRLYKWSGFGEESHQDDFVRVPNDFKPIRVHKIAKLFYPIYALLIHAWQLKVLPNSKLKRAVQKQALKICPKHNYVIQMLLDSPKKPLEENVMGYKPMKGGRWSGILNTWINDRDISVIEKPKLTEYNSLDVDLVRKLYNTISCEPLNP